MPGHDLCQVKCEQTSDDEIQPFPRGFLCIQSASLEELAPLAPAGPAATPVCVKQEIDVQASTLEVLETTTLRNTKSPHFIDHLELESRLGTISDTTEFMPFLTVKDEPLSEGEQPLLSGEDTSDSCSNHDAITRGSPKSWSQQDMENALDALRNHNMTLTKASATFGIPSTTLWQRAHRLGIDTPKKEGNAKSWSDEDLRAALHALRTGAISANKASKAYGIPSSTLYKIARREGIRLAAPFNAAPTTWRRCDLNRALASIRCGAASVQKAAAQFGIPTGTLYGRCKREGIELSRSNPTPWSEDAMGEALEAVRVGQMSINQAAIHYNLPYSSLYGRFKRCKYPLSQEYQHHQEIPLSPENPHLSQHQDGYSYHQIISTPHAAVQHSSENDHSNVSYNVAYHENSLQNTPHASASNAKYQDQLDLGPIMYYSQNCSSEIVTS